MSAMMSPWIPKTYRPPAAVMPALDDARGQRKPFSAFAQEYARTNNERSVRALLDDMGVPQRFGTRWDPQWDYGRVAAAETAAGRRVTPRSWRNPAYDREEYQSPFGQHMAGIKPALEAIPMSEGGLMEPKGGFPLGLAGLAIGLATGNPWVAAALKGGLGAATGGIGRGLTEFATSWLPSPTQTLRRLAGR